MAINTQSTFLGKPVKTYVSGKPEVGQLIMDSSTLEVKIYDGTNWMSVPGYINDMGDYEVLSKRWFDKQNLTDEYLEEEYPEMKVLREEFEEQYELMRGKYKVFELLNRDTAK